MSVATTVLPATAAGIAVLHTLLGPDHYLPFAALAAARGWSTPRMLLVTSVCGLAHVAASVALAAAAGAAGWSAVRLAEVDESRGTLAAWLLCAFGAIYAWRAFAAAARIRTHSHEHVHADGTRHHHAHHHLREHLHPHMAADAAGRTAWALFVVFLFGPCEPLVPLLLAPAAVTDWQATIGVLAAFTCATLGSMLAAVYALRAGLLRLAGGSWRRHAHAGAGVGIAFCGIAMLVFGL